VQQIYRANLSCGCVGSNRAECEPAPVLSVSLKSAGRCHNAIPPETSIRCPFTQRLSSENSAAITGPVPYRERGFMFRFSIGRTF
jgi:hypothetical protein